MAFSLRRAWLCGAVLALTGCGKDANNSRDTDRASESLREAQTDVTSQRRDVATNEEAIARTKREVAAGQQALIDKQAQLTQQRQELGTAQAGLQGAREAYAAAVAERMAKLEAKLATLGTKTDTAAKDAHIGLKARHDQLATKLSALGGTAEAGWATYTRDVDTTFDAIEHDLADASSK